MALLKTFRLEMSQSKGAPSSISTVTQRWLTKIFLAAIEKSDNRTQEAFQKCKPENGTLSTSWLQYVANLEWEDTKSHVIFTFSKTKEDEIIAQKDDFDLKTNALGKWEEQLTGQVTYWHTHLLIS